MFTQKNKIIIKKIFLIIITFKIFYIFFNKTHPNITAKRINGNNTKNHESCFNPYLHNASKTKVQNAIYNNLSKNTKIKFGTPHENEPIQSSFIFPLIRF